MEVFKKINRHIEMCNPFSRIGDSFPRIVGCWNRGNELQSERTDCLTSLFEERIAIRENELSNSRERILNPRERIAKFDKSILP